MQERDPRLTIAELVQRIEQLEVDVKWLVAELKYARELQAEHEKGHAEPGRQPS